MITLKSIGTKVVTAIIATGLAAGLAFASAGSTVTVTLPEAVNVGGTTLQGGQYKITEFSVSSGRMLFVFRSDSGETASVMATRTADSGDELKTELVLSKEGGILHLDKMFIEGDQSGYQFAETK